MYYISSENLYKIHSKCVTFRVYSVPCARDLTLELVLEIDDVAFESTNTGEETIFVCPEEMEKSIFERTSLSTGR